MTLKQKRSILGRTATLAMKLCAQYYYGNSRSRCPGCVLWGHHEERHWVQMQTALQKEMDLNAVRAAKKEPVARNAWWRVKKGLGL